MNKIFHFVSGLPRSGSSLLCGILGQNPSVHASGTSGILGVLANLRNFWPDVAEFKALDPTVSKTRKLSVMCAVLDGFYADIDKPIVFDKNRGWLQHLEMAETIFEKKPKVLVTVRDVREVLASCERLWLERKRDNLMTEQEKANQIGFQSLEGRCRCMMAPDGLVGSSANLIVDAAVRGWRDRMHFVEYDNLCTRPKETMEGIYEFLEIEPFSHDFKNIKPSAFENDEPYGWGDLHNIRPVIARQEQQWPKYLTTAIAMQYSQDATFWKGL